MVNKDLAQTMKEQGLTYKEIAEALNCSEAWCKKNLKGVTKNKADESIFNEVVIKAKSTQGVTVSEIKHIIRALHKNTFNKEDNDREAKTVSRIKAKLRTTEGCLIRPYWMIPNRARDSLVELMKSAHNINDRIEEEVRCFLFYFNLDNSYAKSVRYAIIQLTQAGVDAKLGFSPQTTIDNLESIASILEERLSEEDYTINLPYNTYEKKYIPNHPPSKSIFYTSEDDCEIPESLPLEAYLDD